MCRARHIGWWRTSCEMNSADCIPLLCLLSLRCFAFCVNEPIPVVERRWAVVMVAFCDAMCCDDATEAHLLYIMDLGGDDDDQHPEEEIDPTDGGAAKFAAVDVKSGEENFNEIISIKGKLLRFDEGENQWKERGQGDAKILQFKAQPHRHMFIMRRDGVGKLAAQHELVKGAKIQKHPQSDKAYIWTAPLDYAEDEDGTGYPESFVLKFASAEMGDEFRRAFEKATKP